VGDLAARGSSQKRLSGRRVGEHVVEHPPVAAHPYRCEDDLPAVRVRSSDAGGPILGVNALELGHAVSARCWCHASYSSTPAPSSSRPNRS
jgi:hypothetical protein